MKHTQSINIISILLFPLSIIYGIGIYLYNLLTPSYRAKVDVVCIGNITMGGAGKTPMAINLIKKYKADGYKNIVVVSRGYGGSIVEPTVVDLKNHTVFETGDEPLLIARHTTVVVAKNKKAGVRFAESLGADIIILDDGLQNPTVYKNKVIVVVDGYNGFANGLVFPAGFKRQFIFNTLSKANAIIITGTPGEIYGKLLEKYGDKVYFGKYDVEQRPLDDGSSVVPFCGLGNNDKFFQTIIECGYPIRVQASYPDHYQYTDEDIADLRGIANKALATLITTEKDFVRLSESQRKDIATLPVVLKLDKTIVI